MIGLNCLNGHCKPSYAYIKDSVSIAKERTKNPRQMYTGPQEPSMHCRICRHQTCIVMDNSCCWRGHARSWGCWLDSGFLQRRR